MWKSELNISSGFNGRVSVECICFINAAVWDDHNTKGKKIWSNKAVFLFLVIHHSDLFVWPANLAWLKNCKGTMKKQLSGSEIFFQEL